MSTVVPATAGRSEPSRTFPGQIFPLAGGFDGFDKVERCHVARAGLENIAFALRANLEKIETLAASWEPPIRLGGGLARSHVFPRLLTDVLD